MKKTRFTEEQMVKILREADKAPVTEVAKKHGIREGPDIPAVVIFREPRAATATLLDGLTRNRKIFIVHGHDEARDALWAVWDLSR
jgi:hypothetical protein